MCRAGPATIRLTRIAKCPRAVDQPSHFPFPSSCARFWAQVLDETESVRPVVPGVDRSAIIATDRRILFAKRGELVSHRDPRPQSWHHDDAREIRSATRRSAE